jgi:molecular chaperone DnaK (HSP70)
MNLIGIDIGSQKIVLSKMMPAGPEIILSPSSSRSLPNILSFTENERFIASEQA